MFPKLMITNPGIPAVTIIISACLSAPLGLMSRLLPPHILTAQL